MFVDDTVDTFSIYKSVFILVVFVDKETFFFNSQMFYIPSDLKLELDHVT